MLHLRKNLDIWSVFKSAFTKQRIHLNRESYNVCVLGCGFAGIDIILDI